MTDRAYPTSPAEVTPEWMTCALRAAGAITDSNVTSVSTTPVGVGIGMLGVLCRIAVDYDEPEDGAPTSFVAKFATPVASNRAVAMAYKMYERECGFYKEVLPQIDASAPKCYAAEVEPVSGDCIVVLEDLTHLTTGDQVAGCDAETAKKIMDAFVPLHAKYWGRPQDMTVESVPRIDGENQIIGITAG